LDIADKSIYCDETGGENFDYFSGNDNSNQKISLVIGDVSGHGIPSALLMVTGRAFLRQRVALSGNMASIVTDVNRQMARDIEASGGSMTLFFWPSKYQNVV
jgi:sigma-B regulation protein RsbU (phosphoserine phosphatase)